MTCGSQVNNEVQTFAINFFFLYLHLLKNVCDASLHLNVIFNCICIGFGCENAENQRKKEWRKECKFSDYYYVCVCAYVPFDKNKSSHLK